MKRNQFSSQLYRGHSQHPIVRTPSKKIATDSSQFVSKYKQYFLRDFSFLQDYIIVKSHSAFSFVARIVNTRQYVHFHKLPIRVDADGQQALMARFMALNQLYEDVVVLADNIFMIQEEAGKVFVYVIEAYLEELPYIDPHSISDPTTYNQNGQSEEYNFNRKQADDQTVKYQSLSQWNEDIPFNNAGIQLRIKMLERIKILIDCVHTTGQAYLGLSSQKIILDSDGNVFLAPFALSQELAIDRFTCAYYSPQMIETFMQAASKSNHQQFQDSISYSLLAPTKQTLHKNDIWALGCLAMELFFYSTPIFYQPNNKLQIRQMQSFYQKFDQKLLKDLFQSEYPSFNFASDQSLSKKIELAINLILNCLQWDEGMRKASCERTFKRKPKKTEDPSQIQLRTDRKSQQKSIRSRSKSPLGKTSLSYQPSQFLGSGDCQFTLKLLSLKNIRIKKQLRINIYLNKQYSFFISSPPDGQGMNIVLSNKSIKFRADYSQMKEILDQPILIELREETSYIKVWANLSTLVFVSEGKRVWDKPLIGSFGCKREQIQDENIEASRQRINMSEDYLESKIKLHAQLSTPTNIVDKSELDLLAEMFGQLVQKNRHSSIKNKITDNDSKANVMKQAQQICQNVKNPQEDYNNVAEDTKKDKAKSEFDKINEQLQLISQKWSFNKNSASSPPQTSKPSVDLHKICLQSDKQNKKGILQHEKFNKIQKILQAKDSPLVQKVNI